MALHVPPPVANETDAIVAFPSQADAFRTLLHGLTPHRSALAPSASSLSIGGLLKHATSVQRTGLAAAEAAPALPAWTPVDPPFTSGATVREDVRDFGGGYRGAVVTDPFGNALGIMQRPVVPTAGVPDKGEVAV